MGYSVIKSVSKLTRYSGRRERIERPSCGGTRVRRGEASRRSARAPRATGVGMAVVEVLVLVQV